MGEGFFYGIALGLLLEIVVSDDLGAADGFFQVSVFQGTKEGALVVAPHAGVEVCLQLYAYAHAVGFGLGHTGHLLVGLVQGAQQVLDVMTYLVGYYVRVREVAVGPQLLAHTGEEGKVNIEVFIGRTVERSHSGLALSAGSGGAAGVEHQGRGLVCTQAVICKVLGPDVFRRGQDLAGEFGQGLVLRCGLVVGNRLAQLYAAGLYYVLNHVSQIASHKESDEGYYQNAANTQAGNLSGCASAVFYMGAFTSSVQSHRYQF